MTKGSLSSSESMVSSTASWLDEGREEELEEAEGLVCCTRCQATLELEIMRGHNNYSAIQQGIEQGGDGERGRRGEGAG